MVEGPDLCSMKKFLLVLILLSRMLYAQPPVVIHDTFDKNIGWFIGSTDQYRIFVKDGKYVMQTPDGGWMTYIAPYLDKSKDFYFQATFRQVDGKIDNGIGFMWGYDGKKNMNSFTFTSSGYFRIACDDKSRNISGEWQLNDVIKPLGEQNLLKVEQKEGMLNFYINQKLVASHRSFPWFGKNMGFLTFTKMTLQIDDFILAHNLKIKLPDKAEPVGEKENLGPNVNTQYDEVSPKISADGKTLYFGRKNSPQNIGGINDKEDIWVSHLDAYNAWAVTRNMGTPVNTTTVNNLLSVSTDNNTLLFHTTNGFAFMHRTASGWSALEDLGIYFNNESEFLEGSLAPDGKAILFAAKFKANKFYRPEVDERDIYVCLKKANGTWSSPFNIGTTLNTASDEYSPFLSADGKTLYFASDGHPGYGGVDIFMSKRLSDNWTQWSEPVNLGAQINTLGFDAYYTLPASGEYGYLVNNVDSYGLTDIVRFKLPKEIKPDPVVLVSGKVLNARTKLPLQATIRFEDLGTIKEVGEARSDPNTGDYKIALPAGKDYGFHAAVPGYISVNENLELGSVMKYTELRKDLYLVPLEVGESIKLNNVFFVQSKAELRPQSYPELNRLVQIMNDNPTLEIQLEGHTDYRGNAADNLKLSFERVNAVKAYLVEKGISPARISGIGYGGTMPVSRGDSEAIRQLNRRVEFKITKK
jgi:outer membrane protein OmpA-like peptidoglycan-associated protein